MSNVEAKVLPLGSVDGSAPADEGFLARQGRRMLVLAALVVGLWLLGSLVHSAHAAAAPSPGTSSGTPAATAATSAPTAGAAPNQADDHLLAPVLAPVLRSVETTVGTVLDQAHIAQPVRQLVVGTLQATTDTLVRTSDQVSSAVPQIVSPLTHAVAPVPARPAVTSGGSTSAGTATHHVKSPAHAKRHAAISPAAISTRAVHATAKPAAHRARAAQPFSGARPATPQPPTRAPAQHLPGAGGGVAASQTSAGAAAAAPGSAAFPRTSFLMSTRRSHTAAMLRSTGDRPSVSPD